MKARHWALIAFLVSIPLYQSTTVPARTHQESYFQYFGLVLTALFIGDFWIGSFLVWNLITYVIGGEDVGSRQLLNVLFGSLLFMFSRWYFKLNRFEDYYKPVIFIGCMSVLWMSLQLFGVDPLFQGASADGKILEYGFSDPVGLFAIAMSNGIFLTTVWPMIASLNPILSILWVIPICFSKSSSVLMALALVILFYVYHEHRFVSLRGFKIPFFFILLISIPLGAVYYVARDLKTDPLTFYSRFPSWSMFVNMGFNRALTGHGPDSFQNYNNVKRFKFRSDGKYRPIIQYEDGPNGSAFKFYSPRNDNREIESMTREVYENGGFPEGLPKNNKGKPELNLWDNPHNLFINVFFQYGLVGLFLIFGLLKEIWTRFSGAFKDRELVVITSCILVFLISSLTHFPLELARNAYLFPIILGAFYSKTDKTYQTQLEGLGE